MVAQGRGDDPCFLEPYLVREISRGSIARMADGIVDKFAEMV
jgi:hypothetical protein